MFTQTRMTIRDVDEPFSLASALTDTDELASFAAFVRQASAAGSSDRTKLLSCIPRASKPSYGPITVLAALLSTLDGPWPVLELQQTFNELWRSLPKDAKGGKAPPQAVQLIEMTIKHCKRSYSSIQDLFHSNSSGTAIINPENGQYLSHMELARCLTNFRLPLTTTLGQSKPVVAVSLPNGPTLALTVLATACRYTAAPVARSLGVGPEQFKSDILQLQPNLILAAAEDVVRLGLKEPWLAHANIVVLLVEMTEGKQLQICDVNGDLPTNHHLWSQPAPNGPDDIGIMLFTSGTSGTKKLVPLSVHSLVCGAAMVIHSWNLSPSMRCLNQMPLNHVGGLVRNLLAPLMSGGSVICCTAFDANLFWDCVEDHEPTWYYASPSMHQAILEACKSRSESLAKSKIRLVCNAAGGLLPTLAHQLRDTFSVQTRTIVLPSYGMTECMPISTPPLDYALDRPGTSGVSVGPDIAILGGNEDYLPAYTVGRINVRGFPVFDGYLENDALNKSCLSVDGWFDTGDTGYLDHDGFLYLTGRTKEVINRGGELISPFEVEEAVMAASVNPASPIYGRVSKALAFSVAHDVLQEVVGIAIMTPQGSLRPDLRSLGDAVKSSLSSIKVPVLMVFMDGGLPMNNNKHLRINLADRLGLPSITDDVLANKRYYEAECPPNNTPLKNPIVSRPLINTYTELAATVRQILPVDMDVVIRTGVSGFYPSLVLAPSTDAVRTVSRPLMLKETMIAKLSATLPAYSIPELIDELSDPLPRSSSGSLDMNALDELVGVRSGIDGATPRLSPTEEKLAQYFALILGLMETSMYGDSDFFALGGDSLGAGRLLSAIRKDFNVRFTIDVLFGNSKISSLAKLIEETVGNRQPLNVNTRHSAEELEPLPELEKTCSSTNSLLMLAQLIPIAILYPAKRALTWTVFIYYMSYTQDLQTNGTIPGRLLNIVVSTMIAKVVTKIVAPLFSIAFKWVVIGRYQEGLYPMWGQYHTRWWFVQKVIEVCGVGLFGRFNWSRVLYFRMLGANIGKNVTIVSGAKLGEYDLIDIGDNVVLERCKVRPFAAERNTYMYLGRITIGANSSIGIASIVAAGHTLPESTCVGPNSSSWELEDADEVYRELNQSTIPRSHWLLDLFVGYPIIFFVMVCGYIPWLIALVGLVYRGPGSDNPDNLRSVLLWFSEPERVAFHYLALAAHTVVGPCFYFLAYLFMKVIFNGCMGKIKPSPTKNRSTVQNFRMHLMRTLMPTTQFHKVTQLFGTHYEMTSILARMCGAKVGKRVYWPGTGPTVQDWDLLDIGDDVVFGSRSHIVTSDGHGTAWVKIGSGAMVADRVVLLPGVQVGNRTVLGSGALTKRNGYYTHGTTWVGSKSGEAVCLTQLDAVRVSNADGGKAECCGDATRISASTPTFSNSSSTVALLRPCSSHSASPNHFEVEIGNELEVLDETDALRHSGQQFIQTCPTSANQGPNMVRALRADPEVEKSATPFGRAFYGGQASYRVWGQLSIFCYTTFIHMTVAIYWNIGSIGAVQAAGRLVRRDDYATYILSVSAERPILLYSLFCALIIGIMAAQTIVALFGIFASKWMLLGRRAKGNFDWDKSPYCQRWQLFLNLESFRRTCYGGHGVLGLLTGTAWIALYFRSLGARLGTDCSLFSSGTPSLYFTEPDLLTLGNRVCVDDASLVGHINTRGKFDLNPLYVGDRSVLRSGSRLLSGAQMEADTCLLEHTLVMAGDVVDKGSTLQGWPAEERKGSRIQTFKAQR